jgi:hypothetical protein
VLLQRWQQQQAILRQTFTHVLALGHAGMYMQAEPGGPSSNCILLHACVSFST